MKTAATDLSAVRTVLFDLDGTLIDARPAILASHRHAFREVAGVELDELSYDEGALLAMRIPEAFEYLGFPELGERGTPVYDDYYRQEGYKLAEVYASTRATLDALEAAGYGWGVVTNKMEGRARTDLTGFLGEERLEALVCLITAEDTVERKPHPAPIEAALRGAGLDAATTIYVGDGPHDMEAALAAGVAPVAAGYGYYEHEVLREAGAVAVLEEPIDLIELLRGERP